MTRHVDDAAREAKVDLPPTRVLGWQTEGALAGEYVWQSMPQEARVVASRASALIPDEIGPISEQVAWWGERARAIEGEHTNQLAAAKTQLDQARKALMDDPTAVASVTAAVRAVADLEAADAEVRKSARSARSRAYGVYNAARDTIFRALQAECARVVTRVGETATRLPAEAWSAADAERAMVDAGQVHDWADLVEARARWDALHDVADLLRAGLGAMSEHIRSGAPQFALKFRGWEPALEDNQYRLLAKPLQLAYAVQNKWDPGIWRPSDVDAPPKRKPSLRERMAGVAFSSTVADDLGMNKPATYPTKLGVL